jgi:hypothetical protein
MAKQKNKPTRIIETFVADIKSVSHSPRFQVIIAHGVLELLVNTLVEHHCKSGKKIVERTRDYPHSVKLVLLHEKGLISDFQYKSLDAFRDIRNSAAHEAQFNLTSGMLAPFSGVISNGRNVKLDDPKNFVFLCGDMVMGFWNHGVRLFAPIFEPHLFDKEKS